MVAHRAAPRWGAQGVTNGYRHVAMRLRSLGAADRAWLLDQLLPEERTRIAALLDEVDALHPDVEPEALLDLVREDLPAASALRAPESSPQRGPTAAVGHAHPDMIARVLADEPDWLVARVCAIERWPWLSGYLAAMDRARAARIEALMRDAQPARRALENALVAALAGRLEDSVRRNGFHGLLMAEQRREAGSSSLRARLARWLR
jgi:hypothetical protein